MKNVKELAVPALVLFIICLVSTLLLALTNSVTADSIAKQAVDAQIEARSAVLGNAVKFSDELTITYSSGGEKQNYTYAKGYNEAGNLVGYAITTVAKGYGGDIKIMTGVSLFGEVKGVQILEISETAGLGMKAKNESFLEQYLEKTFGIKVSTATNPADSDNSIDALTGATITSKAVTSAVNLALELYKQMGGVVGG